MSTDNELIGRLRDGADFQDAIDPDVIREAADRLAQLTTERDNVLALHYSEHMTAAWYGTELKVLRCAECSSKSTTDWQEPWPCPTVRAMGVTE